MITAQPITLVPYYYLDNFLQLLHCVEHQYFDLLSCHELELLEKFKSLTTPQQALLVRLYSRKGCLFRSDKLRYKELPHLENIIPELEDTGFIDCNPALDVTELLCLADCKELRNWWPEQLTTTPRASRKLQLIEALSTLDPAAYYTNVPFTVIQLNYQNFVDLLLLLFFGHPGQDLSVFITTELGHVRYENYSLAVIHRLFASRMEIDHACKLMQLRETLNGLDTFTAEIGNDLLTQLPAVASDSPLKTRHDRLCNKIGRALERCQANAMALLSYQKSILPPSRERQARLHFRSNDYITAANLCDAILTNPTNEEELQFAKQYKLRCLKKAGGAVAVTTPFKSATEPFKSVTEPFKPVTEHVKLAEHPGIADNNDRVENLASSYITATLGGNCYYVENWLFNAVFGLTFWKAIFSPVQGAFTHPFQSGPHDLYAATFREKRENEIDRGFDLIQSQHWSETLYQRWQDKYGVSNPAVGWQESGWSILSVALQRIPVTSWQIIFERMLRDLRGNRSGFPDLIHFPANSGYRLLEVKSPTDKLQTNQLRWMQVFAENNIPYGLLQVHW